MNKKKKKIQAIIQADFKKIAQGLKFVVLIPFEEKWGGRQMPGGSFFLNNACTGACLCPCTMDSDQTEPSLAASRQEEKDPEKVK